MPASDLRPLLDLRTRRLLTRLAGLDRLAGSAGEHAAAEAIAGELARRGGRVDIEQERVHGTYWVPIGLASALGSASGLRSGAAGAVGGTLSAALVGDELEIGRRPLRRLLSHRLACNVIAEFGPEAPSHTIVVHAHHDATRTGAVFHPAVAKLLASVGGRLIERIGGTPAPLWGAVAGPAAVAAGATFRRRRMRMAGAALAAGYLAAMIDIASSPPVPGANDNLSGVAALLAVAATLADRPPNRVRVLLLSTGAEESFLEAMKRFGARHFGALPRERTTFLCLESVGSPALMILSGEGMLRLHRYPKALVELLSGLARELHIPLHQPFRYRMATDGQVPLKAGYRTAVISSIDWYKAPSNYHWPSDRPENLDPKNVANAGRLAAAFIAHLDRQLLERDSSAPTPATAAPSPANTTRRRFASSY